jgi:G3E family GTPase
LLEVVVTVADCANFALDLFAADAAMAQINILNKTDLVDEDAVASLKRRSAVIKPRARQIRATFGRVPSPAILSVPEEPALTSVGDRYRRHQDHILTDGFFRACGQRPPADESVYCPASGLSLTRQSISVAVNARVGGASGAERLSIDWSDAGAALSRVDWKWPARMSASLTRSLEKKR